MKPGWCWAGEGCLRRFRSPIPSSCLRFTPPSLPCCWAWSFGALHSSSVGGIRSEEHTSELQSLMRISYAVFCLKKKKNTCSSIKFKLYLKHASPKDIHIYKLPH